MDWGAGSYEITAAQLAPASARVLEAAEPRALQRVLDVACGTGNSAIAAALAGADVTGLDLTQRLLDVAAERAADAGVEVSWVRASATDMPVPDAAFDLVLSVFGVIFARPPQAAADELKRVVAPGGRVMLACWASAGAIDGAIGAALRSLEDVLPDDGPRPGPPSPWAGEEGLRELLAPLDVTISDEALTFTEASPQVFNDLWFDRHPMWLSLRDAVPAERYEAARQVSCDALVAGNEARDGTFRAASPWRLVVAEKPA